MADAAARAAAKTARQLSKPDSDPAPSVVGRLSDGRRRAAIIGAIAGLGAIAELLRQLLGPRGEP